MGAGHGPARRRPFLLALLLIAAAPPDAATLFNAGHYDAAIAAGEAEATPAALLLAGRSRLQVAAYMPLTKAAAHAAIAAALRDFDMAQAKTPANAPLAADLALQRAIAQGYAAQLDSSLSGAKAMRGNVEALLQRSPGNALAWSVLGAWHAGAVAAVGKFIARTMLGANADAMRGAFVRAMTLDPQNPVHPIIYASALIKLDTGNAAQAKALLARAASLPPRDNFEASYKAIGGKLLAAIGDPKAAQQLAKRLSAFGLVK